MLTAPKTKNLIFFNLIAAIAIVVSGLVYTSNIEYFLDIGLYDESHYLNRGQKFAQEIPAAEESPLYAMWYYFLSFFQPDPIKLYYLNYKFLTVLVPLLIFLVLRACKKGAFLSIGISIVFLYSSANFPVWPKVSHFALVVLLFGFLICIHLKDWLLRFFVLCIFSLAASFIRPEFFISFILFAALIVIVFIKSWVGARQYRVHRTVALCITLLAASGLMIKFGLPIGSGERSLFAFGQHYSLNYVKWQNDTRNPWTNWDTILNSEFGSPRSIADAAKNNPSAFAKHIFFNLIKTPAKLLYLARPYPTNKFSLVLILFGLGSITAFAAIKLFRPRDIELFGKLKTIAKENAATLGILTILLIPLVASAGVIYPRDHYLLMLGVFLLIVFVVFVNGFLETSKHPIIEKPVFVVGILITLILISRPIDIGDKKDLRNLTAITFLKSLNINKPLFMLEEDGGYCTYLKNKCTRFTRNSKKKEEDFFMFLKKNKINMIITSNRLMKAAKFKDDLNWQNFISDPKRYGFTTLTIPSIADKKIFVSSSLAN